MRSSDNQVKLSDQPVLGSGRIRLVYDDPRNPDRLIKVLRPESAPSGRSITRRAAMAFGFDVRKREINKEMQEYARLIRRSSPRSKRLPIVEIYGQIQTDLGEGWLFEKVRDDQGGIGKSLAAINASGALEPYQIKALSASARRLLELEVRASDLTAQNIVFGKRASGRQIEAVLVDGFGDTHAIPARTLSRHINARSTHRRLHRIGKTANLVWDEETRVFRPRED